MCRDQPIGLSQVIGVVAGRFQHVAVVGVVVSIKTNAYHMGLVNNAVHNRACV